MELNIYFTSFVLSFYIELSYHFLNASFTTLYRYVIKDYVIELIAFSYHRVSSAISLIP